MTYTRVPQHFHPCGLAGGGEGMVLCKWRASMVHMCSSISWVVGKHTRCSCKHTTCAHAHPLLVQEGMRTCAGPPLLWPAYNRLKARGLGNPELDKKSNGKQALLFRLCRHGLPFISHSHNTLIKGGKQAGKQCYKWNWNCEEDHYQRPPSKGLIALEFDQF